MADQDRKVGDTGRFKAMSEEVAGEVKGVLTDFTTELKRELREDVGGIQRLFREHSDKNLLAHEGTRRELEGTRQQVFQLTQMTHILWKDIRGDEAPPSPPPIGDPFRFSDAADKAQSPASGRGIDDLVGEVQETKGKLSTHDGDIADLAGQMIAVRTELADVKTQNAELLCLQKEQMGKKPRDDQRSLVRRMHDAIVWAVFEREGQRYVGTMLAGLTAFCWILLNVYAAIAGHPPPAIPPSFSESGASHGH